MQIGQTIMNLRKEKELTQKELATLAHLSQVYLSQIEKGRRMGTITILEQIAKGLEIPLPILIYLSLEESDIEEGKQEIYTRLKPVIEAMIKELI